MAFMNVKMAFNSIGYSTDRTKPKFILKMRGDQMEGISDNCNRESCRFCKAGRCTDQEQRNECLDLLNQIIPHPDDRITLALPDPVIKD